MKNLLFIINFFVIVLMTGCDSKPKQSMTDNSDNKISGLCIWKEVSVKETPSEKGKYLSSIYLGERFEVLADTASELVKNKRYKYYKVKLTDGTEGWTMSQFVALNAVPAAFLVDAVIYKRPDLMTATKKNFNAIEFVAVLNQNDSGWAEVIGKRIGDSWLTSGWVFNKNLSYKENDVMVAVLYAKAMEIKDPTSRSTEIQSLTMNSDLDASALHKLVVEKLNDQEDGDVSVIPIDSAASN